MARENLSNSGFRSGLSVDVEDYINLAMMRFYGIDMPPTNNVVENTLRLLELFSEKNVLATFFILGEVAERFPALVKEIAKSGHELGIHGYKHTRLSGTTPEIALKEIKRAKQVVEDISGKQVFGFRAPVFSINEKSIWIFEILSDLGFIYDSSVQNKSCLRILEVDYKRNIQIIKIAEGKTIFEVPPTYWSIFGCQIILSGGGYLRILPFPIIKMIFREISKKQSIVVYTHPYEIDTEPLPTFYKEKIKCSSIKTKLLIKKSHYNRRNLVNRISYLIENYNFTPLIEIINQDLNTPIVWNK